MESIWKVEYEANIYLPSAILNDNLNKLWYPLGNYCLFQCYSKILLTWEIDKGKK